MSKQIDITINVPRFGLWVLWSQGLLFGWTAAAGINVATASLMVLFGALSVLAVSQVVRDTVRSLRVTVSDGEPPACKN